MRRNSSLIEWVPKGLQDHIEPTNPYIVHKCIVITQDQYQNIWIFLPAPSTSV